MKWLKKHLKRRDQDVLKISLTYNKDLLRDGDEGVCVMVAEDAYYAALLATRTRIGR